jgi:GGDEF domain-containing protein
MIHPRFLNKIRHYIKPYYPGYIAVIDIAAFKIRNDLLGHLVGDKDIEELEQIIERHIDRKEFVIRVGGDEWLLFFPNNPIQQLQLIANRYSLKEVKLIVGWQSEAKNKLGEKKIKETLVSTLYRGIKICYLAINNEIELEKKSEIILHNSNYNHRYFIVNQPFETPEIIAKPLEATWNSIDLKLPNLYCPFCYHTKFNWEDGDTSLFGAEGNCKQCEAEVSFSNFCQLKP